MRRLIVTLDDSTDRWLATFPNQADIIRKALAIYQGDITTDTIKGLRVAFAKINERLAGIETAVDKIAQAANVSIDRHGDWGA